ncbi:methyltransferase [Brachybacterium sp. Z12]|uniref:methyltransferase n=1 Tax=Brachybacterium sp. Z12 TaxID=2759167 RepID=UPI00292A5BBC|nr:methyltransferase [Brachybacterium sp. Z12]
MLREHSTGDLAQVVDLCAGSGALGAAVLDELPASRVLSVEIDAVAAELTAENLELAGPGRGRVLQADLMGRSLSSPPPRRSTPSCPTLPTSRPAPCPGIRRSSSTIPTARCSAAARTDSKCPAP